MENRILNYSLLISLIIHMSVIVFLSFEKLNVLKRPLKQIEVTYHAVDPKKKKEVKFKDLEIVKEQQPMKKEDIQPIERKNDLSFKDHLSEISKFAGKLKFDKKHVPKITAMEKQRSIAIPMLKSEKITNPKYLSYKQTIRQKIRQLANHYGKNSKFKPGEIYLTFIIDANGTLKQVKIIENQSSNDRYLRDIGMRSIKESSPFLPFPKDLNYPELTFNVIISFQIN